MLSIEERIAVVGARLRRLTYAQVQEEFRGKFHKPEHTQANIRLLVNKFQRTVKLKDRIRNVDLRKNTGMKDAVQVADELKWKCGGHVARMSDAQCTYRVTMWDPVLGNGMQEDREPDGWIHSKSGEAVDDVCKKQINVEKAVEENVNRQKNKIEEEDDSDAERLYCNDLYSCSTEGWVAFVSCHNWAHNSCAAINSEDDEAQHICAKCVHRD
ncbi:hypothetical protein ANN_09372 [Periplaneta americana]|uniref:DUF4817 domain-containing protein n=1 Tax=Periplaneta americana TaxID=6978 RepID=A0ABQ8TMM4_PERAM|nr:hypothetical protein ANN_09372 [Periplaneta americana]